MKHEKSPGTDGFGAEFFKCFGKQLGPFVVRALNKAFEDGELSTTQKEGIITCIPKGYKPRDNIKNWRPISLLNVIYKIGSSCITNRIKRVLPSLIDDDQTGFISNRYMDDNVRLIYDLINYLNKKNKPGLLLCLDFEKAFDSLDWRFMFRALRAFGFGKDPCFFNQTVKNNSFWSDVFKAYGIFGSKVKPNSTSQLLSEPVVYNKNMMIGNKMIKYTQWVDNGVYCFIKENGRFRTLAEFNTKFGMTVDFLTFNSCTVQ